MPGRAGRARTRQQEVCPDRASGYTANVGPDL